jgi:uncharacterized protein YcbK (DUF882 family)
VLFEDIFDDKGQDGIDNKKAFERLPTVCQYFVTSQQRLLCNKIKNNVVSKYGQEGLKDLVKSSGFRAHSTNTRVGGVVDSLHLWGCAADFLKIGIFKDKPIPVCCNLQIIDSGDCWHIQFRRG